MEGRLTEILDAVHDVEIGLRAIRGDTKYMVKKIFTIDDKTQIAVDRLKFNEIGYMWIDDMVKGDLPLCEVQDIKTGVHYAIKIINLNSCEITRFLLSDLRGLFGLQSDSIMSLNRAFLLDKSMFLVTELAQTDLEQFIVLHDISLDVVKKFIKSILTGVQYLHVRDVVHGELRPSKILISEGCAKLANLCTCRTFWKDLSLPPLSKAIQYRSPESLMGKPINAASDMWSVGCILFYMVMRRDLFTDAEAHDEEMIKETRTNGVKLDVIKLVEKLGEDGFDLLTKLICVNPMTRINSEEALEHPFLDFS